MARVRGPGVFPRDPGAQNECLGTRSQRLRDRHRHRSSSSGHTTRENQTLLLTSDPSITSRGSSPRPGSSTSRHATREIQLLLSASVTSTTSTTLSSSTSTSSISQFDFGFKMRTKRKQIELRPLRGVGLNQDAYKAETARTATAMCQTTQGVSPGYFRAQLMVHPFRSGGKGLGPGPGARPVRPSSARGCRIVVCRFIPKRSSDEESEERLI